MKPNRINAPPSKPSTIQTKKQHPIQSPRYNKKVVISPRNKYSSNYYHKISQIRKQTPFLKSETDLISAPESLLDQKYHLLSQIQKLHAEIEPINKEIQNYQSQIDLQNPKTNEKSEYFLKKRITELQNEYDQLCSEFSQAKEQFNEKVLHSTQSFYDQQVEELNELNKTVKRAEKEIAKIEGEFQDKSLQKRYEVSWTMINATSDLNAQLRSLKDEEEELLEKIASFEERKELQLAQVRRLNRELAALASAAYAKRQEARCMERAHRARVGRLRESLAEAGAREKESSERARFREKMRRRARAAAEEDPRYVFHTFMQYEQHEKVKKVAGDGKEDGESGNGAVQQEEENPLREE